MIFPDMPWMVSNDPVTAQIRDSVRAAWAARTARRDRLYAFGFDAYRLVPGAALQSAGIERQSPASPANCTSMSTIKIRRDLEWAQIKGGTPAVL